MRHGIKVLYLVGDSFTPRIRMDQGSQGAAVLPRPYTLEVLGRALREALGEMTER
jgi:hypothetical protein